MFGSNSRIRITEGDIALMDTEAIVNAANNELWMGSGVAGAIKRAGGSVIEREAVAQGPINVGEAVITGAGKLACLHVIHAAAMAPGRPATAESVRAATAAALRLASDNKIDTLAIPALGTGVGGLSLNDCAEEMHAAITEHCSMFARPEEITIALFGSNAVAAFKRVFEPEGG
jgi:O-acetyl-ADP-ribose deacetylase (regulator of RNase III)